jgi:uncharacterized integral membrane protein (TIGR00698 family)
LASTRKLHPLEEALLGVPWQQTPRLLPGILLAAVVALAAGWLANWLGTTAMGFRKSPLSDITVAILLGLLLNNLVKLPKIFRPGLGFCLKKLLRLGIILLGLRMSLVDVLKISLSALPVVIVVAVGALLLVWQITRRLHLPEKLGLLTAVGTSICGASAIVAVAPCIDASEEEVSYAVANITLFGLLATFVYPYLAHAIFGGQSLGAGLFLGTAIHDTAQVTGAGMIYDLQFPALSPTAGEIAVIAKLVRNSLMALVIPLVSVIYVQRICRDPERKARGGGFWQYLPAFVLGFILMALLRTAGDAMLKGGGAALGLWNAAAWAQITGTVAEAAKYLLALAMASVGLGTSYQTLKGLGARPLLLGFLAAALVGVISTLAITLLQLVL